MPPAVGEPWILLLIPRSHRARSLTCIPSGAGRKTEIAQYPRKERGLVRNLNLLWVKNKFPVSPVLVNEGQ